MTESTNAPKSGRIVLYRTLRYDAESVEALNKHLQQAWATNAERRPSENAPVTVMEWNLETEEQELLVQIVKDRNIHGQQLDSLPPAEERALLARQKKEQEK